MFRFYETDSFKQEAKDLPKRFQYHRPGTKNIIPFVSSLQDIFDVCISNLHSKYGLKNNIIFSLSEHEDGAFYYTAYTFEGAKDSILGVLCEFTKFRDYEEYQAEEQLIGNDVTPDEEFFFLNIENMEEKNISVMSLRATVTIEQLQDKLRKT